jgi:hypothetical protein
MILGIVPEILCFLLGIKYRSYAITIMLYRDFYCMACLSSSVHFGQEFRSINRMIELLERLGQKTIECLPELKDSSSWEPSQDTFVYSIYSSSPKFLSSIQTKEEGSFNVISLRKWLRNSWLWDMRRLLNLSRESNFLHCFERRLDVKMNIAKLPKKRNWGQTSTRRVIVTLLLSSSPFITFTLSFQGLQR